MTEVSWLDERRTTEDGHRDYQCDGSGNVEIFYLGYRSEESLELSEQDLVEMLERLRSHNTTYQNQS